MSFKIQGSVSEFSARFENFCPQGTAVLHVTQLGHFSNDFSPLQKKTKLFSDWDGWLISESSRKISENEYSRVSDEYAVALRASTLCAEFRKDPLDPLFVLLQP